MGTAAQTGASSTGREDHYIPAALLGRFGATSASGKARRSKISVRFRDKPGVVETRRAEDVAKESDVYRFASPPMGVSPDAIDRLWRAYERWLPAAISAIEQNCYDSVHWQMIGLHIAAQGVRHPDFAVLAREWISDQNLASDADFPQFQRIATLSDTFDRLAQTARFAILDRSRDSHRFIINDKGYAGLADHDTDQSARFFPLSSSLMVMAAIGSGASGSWGDARPKRRLTLTPHAVNMVNTASWRQNGIRCVVGHPDDASWIAQLETSSQLVMPELGPYRGVRGGLFDWTSS